MQRRVLIDGLDAPDCEQDDCAAASPCGLDPGPTRWAARTAALGTRSVLASVGADRAAWLAPRLRPAVARTVEDLLIHLRCDEEDRDRSVDGRARVVLNPPERELVAALAADDVPFGKIVNGLRLVQATCAAELLDVVDGAEPGAGRNSLQRHLVEAIAGFFDATVDAVISSYMQDREGLLSQRLTARRTLVHALLSDDQVRSDDVRRSIGITLADAHLALLAWTAEPMEPALRGDIADLEGAARRAAELLRCPPALTVLADDGLWIWLSRPIEFNAADLRTLETHRIGPPGVLVAVGAPGHGAHGFRRTHLTARDAARVSRIRRDDLGAGNDKVVLYRDVGLLALLSADTERTAWFVAEELGELAAAGPAETDLRRTVLCYLDTGSSLVDTAAQMHIHRNTVLYRLRRVQELLGHPITSRQLTLHTALRLAENGLV